MKYIISLFQSSVYKSTSIVPALCAGIIHNDKQCVAAYNSYVRYYICKSTAVLAISIWCVKKYGSKYNSRAVRAWQIPYLLDLCHTLKLCHTAVLFEGFYPCFWK